MNISQMLYLKQKLGYSYDMIAERSGLPKATVQKVLSGVTKHPRYETLQALEKVFSENIDVLPTNNILKETSAYGSHYSTGYVSGTSAARLKRPGEFTIDDYYSISIERRIELIDGFIYDMSSPSAVHQTILLQMGTQISSYIEAKDGPCVPFIAPCDVQIECDDYNMVQPDVFIVCDKKKIQYQRICGAPDFIVEILSKSTSRIDRQIKYVKYYEAGVKEYWIVDPFLEEVTVYLFNQSLESDPDKANQAEKRIIYSFNDIIPVQLYQGELQINFQRIKKWIEPLR